MKQWHFMQNRLEWRVDKCWQALPLARNEIYLVHTAWLLQTWVSKVIRRSRTSLWKRSRHKKSRIRSTIKPKCDVLKDCLQQKGGHIGMVSHTTRKYADSSCYLRPPIGWHRWVVANWQSRKSSGAKVESECVRIVRLALFFCFVHLLFYWLLKLDS